MDNRIRNYFLEKWTKQYGEITDEIQNYFKMKSEYHTVFDKNGVLIFEWTDELIGFDVVIATQTQPRKKDGSKEEYFITKEITKLIKQNSEYLDKNWEFNITTADDKEIFKLMN